MATYNYDRYKILISPESKKTQGLRTGDIVRRQYFDYPNLIYSLMVVLETGIDIIGEKESSYFIGALIEGDEPKNGEILDFVRVTNLHDTDRGGALYLTASDSEAPFMDVIDGLATENSLCYPYMDGGNPDNPDMNKYSCCGKQYLTTTYLESSQEANRIFRMLRNETVYTTGTIGLKQSIEKTVEHPQRLLISFKCRASVGMNDVPLSFGYTNGLQIDGDKVIDIGLSWDFILFMVTVDYPSQYQRSFHIDLSNHLRQAGTWVEVADLNIVLLSDIATFTNATKVRVGKVKGIIDPVFGLLEGYGAYFQNLYATRNVNIAGTLTAGDENGFSSTFYVGKIHKNVILNSIDCIFQDVSSILFQDQTPVGIGNVWKIGALAKIGVQSADWRDSHTGQKYCFSIWVKTPEPTKLSMYQDEHLIKEIEIDTIGEWHRCHTTFTILYSESADFNIRLDTSKAGLLITAPQLEAGKTPSQYQPTDGKLSYVEDYGAWFAKGGIGGTIQNPLLKLNNDGSISSRDESFVIKPDGTGHFASGRFKWTKDTITLQDVTIKWEEFDEETKENIKPKSVTLSGTSVFHYPDALERVCEPGVIVIYATEINFTASIRKWQYLDSYSSWKDLPSDNKDYLTISPEGHYWDERDVLSIKYNAIHNGDIYSAIFTIYKQYDGESSYSIYIDSNNGLVFRNGIIQTTLFALVLKGGVDITDQIPDKNFNWKRISADSLADELWNSENHIGRELTITGEDVLYKAVFDCEVIISTT